MNRSGLEARPPAGGGAFDLVLVGGGLQNALIALARLHADPASRIALVEREPRLGGNHTWCFHADDAAAEAFPFVAPLVEHRWDGYDVQFPGVSRRLTAAYAGLSSDHLGRVVTGALNARPGCALLTGHEATRVGEREVVLRDGRTLSGTIVVDARGPSGAAPRGTAGFQKFLGQELETARPHGIARPVVMDARVRQHDGFRFVYVLPLGPSRLLVEDTYFSDGPDLDRDASRRAIAAYVGARELHVSSLVREETGVLPMPWAGAGPMWAAPPVVAGYRGGWAHPATGYSFPLAVRLAGRVGGATDADDVSRMLRELAGALRPQIRFARLLNRLLFRWYLPDRRQHVFERFYGLPEPTIRRFYALRTTRRDRARILIGRPPRGLSVRARFSATRRLDAAPGF